MINTSIGMLGVAKQTDKATAASTPSFKHGLTGGGLVKPERSIDQKDVACGVRASISDGAFVDEVNIGVDFETLAYDDVLALYLYSACGAVTSAPVTGSTGYYKHTISLGSALPWLTFWGQIGNTADATVQKATGCKIDALALEFEGNKPLNIGITAAGIAAVLFGSWSDQLTPSCFEGYFVPTNGTFKIDTASSTPSVATVTKGSLELSNTLKPYRSAGTVIPSELAEGKLSAGLAMTVIPDDWALIRKLITGSSAGTSVSSGIVYGSMEWNFTHTKDSTRTLKIVAQNVPWNCEMPEVDPEGNAAEIEFKADNIGVASSAGSPISIELVNKTASYTS